jgi:hypothetical protein
MGGMQPEIPLVLYSIHTAHHLYTWFYSIHYDYIYRLNQPSLCLSLHVFQNIGNIGPAGRVSELASSTLSFFKTWQESLTAALLQ